MLGCVVCILVWFCCWIGCGLLHWVGFWIGCGLLSWFGPLAYGWMYLMMLDVFIRLLIRLFIDCVVRSACGCGLLVLLGLGICACALDLLYLAGGAYCSCCLRVWIVSVCELYNSAAEFACSWS